MFKKMLGLLSLCTCFGTAYPQTLEIHQMTIGAGDAALIVVRDTALLRQALQTNPNIVIPSNKLLWLKLAIDSNVVLNGTVKKAVLIDAGKGAVQADKINGYMKKTGVIKLNYTVLSHYHDDHFGGFAKLFQTYKYYPDTAYDRGYDNKAPKPPPKCRNGYIKLLNNKGVPRIRTDAGITDVRLGANGGQNIQLTCVAASGYVLGEDIATTPWLGSNDENDYSVGWILQYGAFRFFTGGDLNGLFPKIPGETYLADSLAVHDKSTFTNLNGTALDSGHVCSFKLDHHGGAESTNDYFLSIMRPSTAITSCGYSRSYFHPRIPVISVIDSMTGSKWDISDWTTYNPIRTNTIKNCYFTALMDTTAYLAGFPGLSPAQKAIYTNLGNPALSYGVIAGDVVVIVDDNNISTQSNYLVYWNGDNSATVVTGKVRTPNAAGTKYYQCHRATHIQYYP